MATKRERFLWFPFYPDDFSSDRNVEAMTTEQVGAFWLLCCKAWNEPEPGHLPDNDTLLARWARVSPERWTEIKAGTMAAFSWDEEKKLWVQKRLVKECKLIVKKSRAAKASIEKRWNNERINGRNTNVSISNAIRNTRASDSVSVSVSDSQEGGLGEGDSDQKSHPHFQSAFKAFDRWACLPETVGRGAPLRDVNNEHAPISALLARLDQLSPIVRGNRESVTRSALCAKAVDRLVADGTTSFKDLRYAVKCAENLLEKWASEGEPMAAQKPESNWKKAYTER